MLALAQTTGNLYEDSDPTRLDVTAAAAQRAYADAGLAPTDMQVGEVHDCFTVTELLMYEALGFADYTKGAALIREGRTAIDGDIPVNTGGGLVGFGHPVLERCCCGWRRGAPPGKCWPGAPRRIKAACRRRPGLPASTRAGTPPPPPRRFGGGP